MTNCVQNLIVTRGSGYGGLPSLRWTTRSAMLLEDLGKQVLM